MKLAQGLQSSSRFMHLMVTSQMSLDQLHLKQLMLNFDMLDSSVCDFFRDFMDPYLELAKAKNLRVSLKFLNNLPD